MSEDNLSEGDNYEHRLLDYDDFSDNRSDNSALAEPVKPDGFANKKLLRKSLRSSVASFTSRKSGHVWA